MVARPGILILGGTAVQGGTATLGMGIDGSAFSNAARLGSRELMRAVPDNPATGDPTSPAFKPWYHGHGDTVQYVSTGASTTYIETSGTPFDGENLVGQRAIILNYSAVPGLNGIGFRAIAAITSHTNNRINFASLGFTPDVGSIFMVGRGRFESYHAVQGWISNPYEIGTPSYRGGSAWNAFGQGIGPDASMVRRIYEDVYPSPPYFYIAKYATPYRVYNQLGDAPNNGGRAQLLAEIQRIEQIALDQEGDTIDWQYVHIDYSTEDFLVAAGDPTAFYANYQTSLQQFITWLRGTACGNPNLLIGLVSHDPRIYETTAPTAAGFVRSWHANIVRADSGGRVGIIDMKGRDFGGINQSAPTGTIAEAVEPKQYAYYEMLWQGRESTRLFQRLLAGQPAAPSGGFPVYVFIGDSITTGGVEIGWVQASDSEEISGPNSGNNTERPANQKIWNGNTQQLEVFDPAINSNTLQSTPSLSGPELSIMAELGKIHPQGFAVLKLGSSGSGMAISLGAYTGSPGEQGAGGRWLSSINENWTILEQEFAAMVAYINQQLGQQADMKGCFVSLGHNDHSAPDGGTVFAANIDGFVNDLWDTLSTRTSGNDFPIVWRRPQADVQPGISDPTKLDQVRKAIETTANKYRQVRMVSVDGLERNREDDLHETPATAVETGRRMVKALLTVAI